MIGIFHITFSLIFTFFSCFLIVHTIHFSNYNFIGFCNNSCTICSTTFSWWCWWYWTLGYIIYTCWIINTIRWRCCFTLKTQHYIYFKEKQKSFYLFVKNNFTEISDKNKIINHDCIKSNNWSRTNKSNLKTFLLTLLDKTTNWLKHFYFFSTYQQPSHFLFNLLFNIFKKKHFFYFLYSFFIHFYFYFILSRFYFYF